MKIILVENVERLGEKGQVVSVKDGYARNFLLPRKVAIAATPARMKQLDTLRAQFATREDKTRKRLAGLAEKMAAVSLEAGLKMGEEGAFGAITNADVCKLLSEKGFDVDRRAIVLEEPIRHPGTYDIPVKLGHEVTATVKLMVAQSPA